MKTNNKTDKEQVFETADFYLSCYLYAKDQYYNSPKKLDHFVSWFKV